MKRISVIILGLASVVLTILSCVSTQAPTTAAPKAGKPLVKRLPAKIEGVELVGGTVKAKPGYKFVKQPNGTATVARIGGGGGGPGLGGTWSCSCMDGGTCSVIIVGGWIWCFTGSGATCTAYCELSVTTTGLRQAIMAY
jgi:hypothetical protein